MGGGVEREIGVGGEVGEGEGGGRAGGIDVHARVVNCMPGTCRLPILKTSGASYHAGSAVWNAFTAGTVAATTALAIFTPSIDIAIEFIGATAGVLVSFVWPMMLLYKASRRLCGPGCSCAKFCLCHTTWVCSMSSLLLTSPTSLPSQVKRDRGELDWATRLLIGVIITLGLLVTVVGVGGVFSI